MERPYLSITSSSFTMSCSSTELSVKGVEFCMGASSEWGSEGRGGVLLPENLTQLEEGVWRQPRAWDPRRRVSRASAGRLPVF